MAEDRYWAGSFDESKADYVLDTSLPITEVTLPEELRILDVETTLEGKVGDERAMTRFLPQGFSTPTWVHIKDEASDKLYTLVVHPLTGKAEILDGRVEMERKGF